MRHAARREGRRASVGESPGAVGSIFAEDDRARQARFDGFIAAAGSGGRTAARSTGGPPVACRGGKFPTCPSSSDRADWKSAPTPEDTGGPPVLRVTKKEHPPARSSPGGARENWLHPTAARQLRFNAASPGIHYTLRSPPS